MALQKQPGRHPGTAARILTFACAFGVLLSGSPGEAEELSEIPIPAVLRPPLQAACEAWGSHVEGLIEQHRTAGQTSEEELQKAIALFYAAKAYCSMGCLLESLAAYEKVSLGRVKPRPAW